MYTGENYQTQRKVHLQYSSKRAITKQWWAFIYGRTYCTRGKNLFADKSTTVDRWSLRAGDRIKEESVVTVTRTLSQLNSTQHNFIYNTYNMYSYEATGLCIILA
jgi:hypothetical protein